MTTDLDRFELARQRLSAPKPVDVPLVQILAEKRDADTVAPKASYVTDPQAVRHLHLSGFIVAPEMVEAHHAEALIENLDRASNAFREARRAMDDDAINAASRWLSRAHAEQFNGNRLPVNEHYLHATLGAAIRMDNDRALLEFERAHAEAIDLDPAARELAIFRTNASRHLSGDELVRAVDAYADDLRKRDQDAAEGRCEACGNTVMFNEPHGATCPLDEQALEEAAGRVLALRSAADLDMAR